MCSSNLAILCTLCCCLICCGCAYNSPSALDSGEDFSFDNLNNNLNYLTGHHPIPSAQVKLEKEKKNNILNEQNDGNNSTIIDEAAQAYLLAEILSLIDVNNDTVIDHEEFDELFELALPELAAHGHEHEDHVAKLASMRRALFQLAVAIEHPHAHSLIQKEKEKWKKIKEPLRNGAGKRFSEKSTARAIDEACPPAEEIFAEYDTNEDGVLVQQEIVNALLLLMLMKLSGCDVAPVEPDSCDAVPEAWESWLAALGSVALVCIFSLVGVLIIPCLDSKRIMGISAFIMMLMIAFASGALLGDAIFHIIPEVFEANAEAGDVEKDHLKTLSLIIVGIFVFFLIEKSLMLIVGHGHSHGGALDDVAEHKKKNKKAAKLEADENAEMQERDIEDGAATSSDDEDDGENDDEEEGSGCNCTMQGFTDYFARRKEAFALSLTNIRNMGDGNMMKGSAIAVGKYSKNEVMRIRYAKSYGWLNLTADAFHNFIDGLAIGAAYSQSLSLGLSTTLAVVFHEIPQELGDYALIVKSGFGKCFALFFNFLSAMISFIGVLIGLGVGEATNEADRWILSFTAGGFIYISCANMFPELNDYIKKRSWWGLFALCTQILGFLIGIVVLLVIALEEEHQFACRSQAHNHDH